MIGRLVACLGWTAICFILFVLLFLITQMGDCFDVKECGAYKDRAAVILFIVSPLVWLAGAIFLFRRWNR